MPQKARDIYWIPWEEPGCEHVSLWLSAAGVRARGTILRMRDGEHFHCSYELEADAAWRVRRLEILAAAGGDGTPHRLLLECDGSGRWKADGAAAPALEGCQDVDIQVTPFTNSLPIHRLGLAQGESADIRVVYVPAPELTPRPVEQRYTCLKALDPQGGGLYRYEGLFRNFAAELAVDADGLVMDYPETFRRSWPA